jgi:hypothetical protein
MRSALRTLVPSSNSWIASSAFFFGYCHAAKQTSATFGVRLAALRTAETAKAVALSPKLHAFAVAGFAIHNEAILQ